MERSKVIVWVGVAAASCVIVWWVGFHGSSPSVVELKSETPVTAVSDTAKGGTGAAPDANQAKDAAKAAGAKAKEAAGGASKAPGASGDPNRPRQAKQAETRPGPGEPNGPGQAAKMAARGAEAKAPPGKPPEGKPPESKPGQAKIKEDPNDPLEAINLKDVEMKNLIEKIAQWTGKTVIPADQAMTQKITIYAPDKMPRSKALLKIYSALRMKGFMPEVVEDTIYLRPLAEAKLGTYPIVGPDQPLAQFENKNQVVQKFFKLAHYSPAQMSQIVQPLVGEGGHVSADEASSRLLVIDTVGNLMRIESIIGQFDMADAGRTVSEIFEIKSGDPVEIVQFLRLLLGEAPDGRRAGPMRGQYTRMSASVSKPSGGPPSGGPPAGGPPGSASKAASSVVIGASDIPLILIPEAKHKRIIARGSAEDIKLIGEWIAKLDVSEPVKSECETVSIIYADVREVAQQIEKSLQQMSGTDLKPNLVVQPLEQTRQIMIFGRPDLRDMVKKLIAEVDMPPGQFQTENFKLKHADPDQVKTNIEGLYESQSGSTYSYGYRSSRFRNVQPSETVKAISYPSMKQVTVIASPENMTKIRKQIEEWDVALDINQVKPRIIELKNSDPVKMSQLLTKLFSEASDDMSRSFMRLIFYGSDESEQKKKIIGPLYGQLTFENVPETKKIIVISKIPEAYDIVEQLILDLDRQEMAEVPKVVVLKYADPEDLSERLNAMFNEPGTVAPIRRRPTGLGNYSMEQTPSGNQSGGQPGGGANANNPGGNANEYTPWWSRAGVNRGAQNQQPLSNVIGHVRFIPDPHSKAILVLAPPEFHADIEQTISRLDVPGMQVMIKATVVEVDHSALTSLGLELATNPAAFDTSQGNSAVALGSLSTLSTGGRVAAANNALGATGTGTIVGTQASVYALIDFLVKHVNAKILNEQTLWTEDNEEASFFKGSKVAFLGGSTIASGGLSQSNVNFEKVGMQLAVRPSITPEKNVNMIVNILLSQLSGDLVNNQPVRTEMDTKTNMIVHDSETLMLGGILFQEKNQIKHKVPLLGDLPLIGGLFQHNSEKLSNNEMIVFITPFVISEGAGMSEAAKAALEKSKARLDRTQQELGDAAEKLDETLDNE